MLVGAVAIISSLAIGPMLASSSAFSTLTGERGTSVTIVENKKSYLGVDAKESVRAHKQTELATLTNNLQEPATVSLELLGGSPASVSATGDTTFHDDQVEILLDPGSSASVEINATPNQDSIDYQITSTTDATSIRLERAVEIGSSIGGGGEQGRCSSLIDPLVVGKGQSDGVDTERDVRVKAKISIDIDTAGTVRIASGGRLDGNIDASNDVIVSSGARVGGDIDAGGSVCVKSGARVGGDINNGGETFVDSGGRVDGNIDSGDSVRIDPGAAAYGDIDAGGDVITHGKVDGDINTPGSIRVGKNGRVEGNVDAGESVIISSGGRVKGDVDGKTVTVQTGAKVTGDVTAENEVIVDNGAKVEGNIDEG
jgi:cytoskeletal protein CcmA (bactofilin family)